MTKPVKPAEAAAETVVKSTLKSRLLGGVSNLIPTAFFAHYIHEVHENFYKHNNVEASARALEKFGASMANEVAAKALSWKPLSLLPYAETAATGLGRLGFVKLWLGFEAGGQVLRLGNDILKANGSGTFGMRDGWYTQASKQYTENGFVEYVLASLPTDSKDPEIKKLIDAKEAASVAEDKVMDAIAKPRNKPNSYDIDTAAEEAKQKLIEEYGRILNKRNQAVLDFAKQTDSKGLSGQDKVEDLYEAMESKLSPAAIQARMESGKNFYKNFVLDIKMEQYDKAHVARLRDQAPGVAPQTPVTVAAQPANQSPSIPVAAP